MCLAQRRTSPASVLAVGHVHRCRSGNRCSHCLSFAHLPSLVFIDNPTSTTSSSSRFVISSTYPIAKDYSLNGVAALSTNDIWAIGDNPIRQPPDLRRCLSTGMALSGSSIRTRLPRRRPFHCTPSLPPPRTTSGR